MDSIRRALDTIRKQLGGLTATHKVLVGCMVVLILMGLAMVALLTSRPTSVPLLAGATPVEQDRAVERLSIVGIETYIDKDGRLMVEAGRAKRANVVLSQEGLLPADKALYFENLITGQSWMNSRQLNEQQLRIAVANELGRTISEFAGVDKARVQIDLPDSHGLGVAVRKPTASISLKGEGGKALSQELVDSAAQLVAGSCAGLTLERVTVIDAGTGRPRTVSTSDSVTPGIAMEHAQKAEQQARAKFRDLLAYVPGVGIEVTVTVDVSRSTSQVQTYLPEDDGTVKSEKRTHTTNSATSEASPGAIPGVQANQTADIVRDSGGGGIRTSTTENTTENETRFGSKTETIVDPKGQSKSVAVSVTVPTGYVAHLLKPTGGKEDESAPPPTETQLQERFEASVAPAIRATLEPHVRAMLMQGHAGVPLDVIKKMAMESVDVALVPGDLPAAAPQTQAAGILGALTSGEGGSGLPGGLIEKGVLGLLALTAMGMMIAMARKAGRKAAMPTAEELVGQPPALENQADIMGEAEEGETAMAGIEVGEEDMQAAKVLEQVGEMVAKDPESASKMLNRWVDVEE